MSEQWDMSHDERCEHTKVSDTLWRCSCAERWYQQRLAEARAALEWLDNNTIYFRVRHPVVEGPNIPALAAVSKRIWYHATDDVKSSSFSEVIHAALASREKK